MDDATLTRLKSEHDEVTTLTAAGISIVVKNPSKAAFDRFMSGSAKKEHAHKALATLVLDCIVHPSIEEWTKILDRRPGLAITFGSELAKIAGIVDEVDAKKA